MLETKPPGPVSEGVLDSKKAKAYFYFMALWIPLTFFSVWWGASDAVIITELIIAGFVTVGYILGQAALDLFVRCMSIVAQIVQTIYGGARKAVTDMLGKPKPDDTTDDA